MKIQIHQVLISLLIGLVLGYGVSCWQGKDFRRFPKDGDMKKFMMDKLDRELHLSAEQRTQIEAIFKEKHPQMLALHEEMRPKFEALRGATHEEVRKVLNPEQQQKFEELNKQREERRKKRLEGFKF